MSSDPIFASTINRSAGLVPATADTSLTAPTNATTVFTAGASGAKVEEIRLVPLASFTAAQIVVNLFIHDGSTYKLFDTWTSPAGTVSTTSGATPVPRTYPNLVLKAGETIRATVTVAAGQSLVAVLVFGADF